MKFTKMQGIGNDYIYVDCFSEKVEDPSALAVRISDRHFGVGSDGLILIKPSDQADFEMEMYNADGSRGKMCGNGIRCVGKYVYDNGLTDQTRISIETLAGIKYLELFTDGGKVTHVRVDMGEPILTPALIPVLSEKKDLVRDEAICVAGREWRMTCVSMGNPHCVVPAPDVAELDLEKIGPQFEHLDIFPDKVNTEFIHVRDRQNIDMRVWERGSGETLACGTGACASVTACILNDWTVRSVRVHLLGGELLIEWDRETNKVFMTGPAETVFQGIWPD